MIDELWQDRHLKQHSLYTRTQDMSQPNRNQNTEVSPQVLPTQSSPKIFERTPTKNMVRKTVILIYFVSVSNFLVVIKPLILYFRGFMDSLMKMCLILNKKEF